MTETYHKVALYEIKFTQWLTRAAILRCETFTNGGRGLEERLLEQQRRGVVSFLESQVVFTLETRQPDQDVRRAASPDRRRPEAC